MLLLLLTQTHSLSTLLGVSRSLDHFVRNRTLAGTGLTIEQASILAELDGTVSFASPAPQQRDPEGFLAFGALAAGLILTKPALSRRLSELETLGLVERRSVQEAGLSAESHQHGNAIQVRLTAKGRRRLQPVIERMKNLAADLFGSVTPTQRSAHAATLQRLAQRLSELRRSRDRR